MSGGGKSLFVVGGCVDVGVLVDVDKDVVVIGVGLGFDLVMSGNWKLWRFLWVLFVFG